MAKNAIKQIFITKNIIFGKNLDIKLIFSKMLKENIGT